MKRSISSLALLFTSISAIIGSGWLFSSYYSSILAGPAVLISWVLGGIAMIIVAFVFGELCTMIPISGSSTRIPQYTHGTVVSFIFAWIIWLAYASFGPIEVQAVIQYIAYYIPSLLRANGGLTLHGYLFATSLLLLITIINVYSLRWLIRCNNVLTTFKIIVPTFIAIVTITHCFHQGHDLYPPTSQFMPLGIRGILAAISSGGIVFAFSGFKQAAELAGEAKNPRLALPIALVGSIVLCMIIFILLQLAFLTSLNPEQIKDGWANLHLIANMSPFATIAAQNNLQWLLPILYICAIISPMAAAMMYCGSSSRSLYGMSKNGYIPALFQKLTPQGSPINATVVTFVVGLFMFAPLPGWGNMVCFLSSLLAVTYSVGPICLIALRQQLPDYKRVCKLPLGFVWGCVAFYICTLMIYWCGWPIIYKLSIALCGGFLVLLFNQIKVWTQNKSMQFNWQASIWMWAYFIGLTILSYLGGFGGHNIIPFGWDMIVIGIFSLFIAWLSLKFKLPTQRTRQYIADLHLETQAGIH